MVKAVLSGCILAWLKQPEHCLPYTNNGLAYRLKQHIDSLTDCFRRMHVEEKCVKSKIGQCLTSICRLMLLPSCCFLLAFCPLPFLDIFCSVHEKSNDSQLNVKTIIRPDYNNLLGLKYVKH